jgi:hypothetical protein
MTELLSYISLENCSMQGLIALFFLLTKRTLAGSLAPTAHYELVTYTIMAYYMQL